MKRCPSDSEYQYRFVAKNAWRLLAMQQRDPISRTRGCLHYAHRRGNTSGFPDSWFHEAGVTLGLLSLSKFDGLREIGIFPSVGELRQSHS